MTAKTGLRLAVLVAAVLMLTASASALEAGLEPEGAIEPGEALRYTGGGSPDAIYWWVYTGEFGENERIFDHGSGVTFMPSSRLEKGKEYKVMVYSEDVDAGEKDTAKSSFIIKKEKTKSDVQIQAPGQGSPEAIINAEKNSVTEGEMLKLSAEESYSPNGDIAEYRWKIGEEVKKGKTIAPKFFQPGTRTVELTITDSQGETATATKKIKIGKEEEKFVHAQIMDAEDGEAVSSIKAIKGKTMHLEADTTDLPPNVTYRWKIGSNQDYIKNPDKKGYRTVSKGSDR
ncbi:MAG: PKD domain-containing protein, partial [Candidatus Nanohaloarchaea archaeon]|nr:PKD domain-containing protein [Candidatus Nanohaloarchaea archaeon]